METLSILDVKSNILTNSIWIVLGLCGSEKFIWFYIFLWKFSLKDFYEANNEFNKKKKKKKNPLDNPVLLTLRKDVLENENMNLLNFSK